MHKPRLRFIAVLLMMIFMTFSTALAAPKWTQVYHHIDESMQQVMETYKGGDAAGARKGVDDTYYGIYEKDGLETAIRSGVSVKNVNLTEYQFYKIKQSISKGASVEEVQQEVDKLLQMIQEDSKSLEETGASQGGWASFWPAFLILIREGVEAILVLVAIIAYLRRSNNERFLNTVYNYSVAAIIASFISAYLFTEVMDQAGGASREIIEGGTALVAVVVLLLTSAWLGSKADKNRWKEYVEAMVKASVTSGKAKALGFAAFLAVYREGAEVILFYQALFNSAAGDTEMIWGGFAAGCVVLAIIFMAIQQGILHIPLRPFFLFTSILMYILAISFAGSGIEELQEGGVIGITRIESIPIPTIDFLGIYPHLETLSVQFLLIILAIGMVYYRTRKSPQISGPA